MADLVHFQIFFPPKMVSLPKLANCCACISLKTGTLIIGALNLIGSLIFIPVSIALMAGTNAFVDQMRQMLGQSAHYDRQTIASGDGDDDDGVDGDDDDGDGDDGGDDDGDGVDGDGDGAGDDGGDSDADGDGVDGDDDDDSFHQAS